MAFKKSQQEPATRSHIQCAHDLCAHSAILRLKLPTGWANLCRHHYDFHAQREADKFCAENGLITLEQKRAFCLQKMLMFGKVDPVTHWEKVLATEGLSLYSYECAREALEFLKHRGREAA
jgi:hypothetical protein